MRTILIKTFHALTLAMLISLLGACTHWLPDAHRIDIQQGNIIKQAERDSLEIGMSKQAVIALLGKAILQDPYHPDRWDYIYTLRSETEQNRVSRLTVFFEDNQLVKIDDSAFDPEE